MRFSVLLPTRNGAPYLRDTIVSVLSQQHPDLELVISDNASNTATQLVVDEFLNDPRVKVLRHSDTLTVTDNWNAALGASSGDYVLMLGDDDCVMPECFQVLENAVTRHGFPDCVTFNGYSFVYPGSVDENAVAYFAPFHFKFDSRFTADSELPIEFRRSLVFDMYRFRVRFPLNMQLTLFARRAANAIRGGVFRPPFPDHYALVTLLLTAARMVYVPDRLVVVGVSPKSFGHFFYSGEAASGARYLGLEDKADGRIPGNDLVNNMRDWLSLVKTEYPQHLSDTEISHWNYVARQVHYWARRYEFGKAAPRDILRILRMLSWIHILGMAVPLFLYRLMLKLMRVAGVRRVTLFRDMWPALRVVPGVTSILEFVRWTAQRKGLFVLISL